MKTLQQEIVDFLRTEAHREYNGCAAKKIERFGLLIDKVESARCENCEHYAPGEDEEGCKLIYLEYQGPNFGCWNFKEK